MGKRAKKKAAAKAADPVKGYSRFRESLMAMPTVEKDGTMPIEVVEKLHDSIEKGCSYNDAARCLGVTPAALNRWLSEGRREMELYWSGKIKKAEITRYGILAFNLDARYAKTNEKLIKVVHSAAAEGNVNAAIKALRWRNARDYSEEVVADAAMTTGEAEESLGEAATARNDMMQKIEAMEERQRIAASVSDD